VDEQQENRSKTKVFFELAFWLAIFVFIVALRMFLYKSRNFDEGIYALIPKMMNNGLKIYKDIWADKPPLLFLINQVGFKIFGYSLVSITICYSVVSVLAGYLLYKVGTILINEENKKYAALASALWLVFTTLPLGELFWMMSETYLLVFELLTILFLYKGFCRWEKYQNIYTIMAGFFLFATFMIRPTAAVFILTVICFFLFRKADNGFKYFVLGILLSIGFFALYLRLFSNWHDFIYQVFLEKYNYLSQVAPVINDLKNKWFNNYLISAGPLWILALVGAVSLRSRRLRENQWFILLAFWIILTIAFYKFFDFAPGFGHEYAETLAPLAIFGSLGIKAIFDFFRNKQIARGVSIVILLLIISGFSVRQNIVNGEWRSNDTKTLNEISDYYKQNVSPSDDLFVLETKSLKLGPLIYFLVKSPSIISQRNTLTIPVRSLTLSESDALINQLETKQPKQLLVIDGPPPLYKGFEPINNLYSYLMTNYKLKKKFPDYLPYPGRLGNMAVEFFQKVEPTDFTSKTSLDLNKVAGVSKTVEKGGAIKMAINTIGLTAYYRFAEATDLENKLIEIDINGNEAGQYLTLDLIDTFGRWSRATVRYWSGNQTIQFYTSNYAFKPVSGAPANLNLIKQINIILPVREEVETYTINAINILK